MTFADALFNLFVGESFIPLIISVVVNIFFVPFGIVGLKHFFNWIDRNFTKPGAGYVYVRQKMPNDRFRYFWMRPTGRMGVFKTITGEDIEKPVNTKKGFVAYDGALPMVEFDENGNQIKYDSEFSRPGAGQEDSIKGQKAAYEAGKFMGGTEIFNDLKIIMIAVLVVGILGTVITVYFSYKASSYTPSVDTSAVAAEVVALLQNPSYNMTAGIPAIGGG